MIISREQSNQMFELAKPLIKWLCENAPPHCEIIITQDSAELTESISLEKTDEFIID